MKIAKFISNLIFVRVFVSVVFVLLLCLLLTRSRTGPTVITFIVDYEFGIVVHLHVVHVNGNGTRRAL
jgi:hypothetical protein